MIEELDTDIAINGQYPVTYFVDVVDKFALPRTQTECYDWALPGIYNPGSHCCHHTRDGACEVGQQAYRTLYASKQMRSTMARLSTPECSIFVILESGNEILSQTV